MDPLDREDLKAIYDIRPNTPPCELVAALRRDLQDINPNRLFAWFPCRTPQPATSLCGSSRHSSPPGMHITDHLVDAWIWCFNFNQPNQERVWVPHLGWAHTLIAPPTEPRPAPSTGGRQRAAPQLRANPHNIPPFNGLADWESRTDPTGGATAGTWWSDTHQGQRRHAGDPCDTKMTPAPSP